MSDKQKKAKKTSIGGQALIEGIMMKGPSNTAMAVRLPSGEIDVEIFEGNAKLPWYRKVPFLRGVINFVLTLYDGYSMLMKSAEKAGFDDLEEETKFDKWLREKFGDNMMKVISAIAMVLGVVLALGLFIVIPMWTTYFLDMLLPLGDWKTLVEGILKIAIFVAYIGLCTRVKEVHRVFQYHGSEHKCISCYESGEELTVENVRKHSRFHPRCGTSFILISLVISMLVASVVTWSNPFLRMVIKLVTMPLAISVSYEIIKLAGRYDNPVTRIISKPGMWLQRLTTAEPDDSMIEVALASLMPVLPKEGEDDRW